MSDFAFLDKPSPERTRAQHIEDVRREFFKSKLKQIANQCEQAQDYCRDMINAGSDVTEELKELETTGRSLLLVRALLEKAANDKKAETPPFWTAAE